MAEVRPFAALRPDPTLALRVCAPPYDVMSEAEARALAEREELSFVHVSRPEVGLPPGSSPKSPEAYAAAQQAFRRLRESGTLRLDAEPSFHLYRQELGSQAQTGVVALASCAEYESGAILKHELTRVEKEEDRVRHMDALNAQTGPAFLFHQPSAGLAAVAGAVTSASPDIEFTADDRVRHTVWRVTDPETNERIQREFATLARLYIADGHHRSAAAARVWLKRGKAPAAAGFLAVLFPCDQLQILPYHRVLKDLNGHSLETLLGELGRRCVARTGEGDAPLKEGDFNVYLGGGWHRFGFRAGAEMTATPAEVLDVARLQADVLQPVFGIDDPRTSERIDFVGGIRGLSALRKMVDHGESACAIAMAATPIEHLVRVADGGGVMPPKSTWFEPKLRDALFCNLL